jgi:CDP-glucose 4,6-dehydratase
MNKSFTDNMSSTFNCHFYKGKRVFLTGHTGFKGSWMCRMLHFLGAEVYGYALKPPTEPSLFDIASVRNIVKDKIGDIRNLCEIKNYINSVKPEIVIHMAAQPIVLNSYLDPVYTYETNVMGTVNILEAIRECDSVKSFLNVTTDKVYQNNEWFWPYRENDHLDGYDPYSNSKSCSELVTHSYDLSFLREKGVAVSTARAGNVIGGGDFADHRIIPDCVRAVQHDSEMIIRNPLSIRPYQHVLEPIYAYLMICARQYDDSSFAGSYNIGPNETDCITTKQLVDLFNQFYEGKLRLTIRSDNRLHEANILKLDCSKIKSVFGWKPRWNIEKAVEKAAEWSKAWLNGENMSDYSDKQIREFFNIQF